MTPPPRLLLAFYKAENEQKAFCSFAIFGHKTWDLEGGQADPLPQAYPGFQVPQLCSQDTLIKYLVYPYFKGFLKWPYFLGSSLSPPLPHLKIP